MKLTIIVDDGMVIKDNVGRGDLNLQDCQIPSNVSALQWNASQGWIEFKTNVNNQTITSLPAWATAAISVLEEAIKPPPPLTDTQLTAIAKETAEARLQSSDWSMLADVNLANKDEWISYRASLRNIVINPIPNPVFPELPKSVWA